MRTAKNLMLTLIITAVCIVLALHIGSVKVSVQDIFKAIFLGGEGLPSSTITIVLKLRLPRIILAFLVGGCLSMAGCVLQAILRNPLADPYIIGASSGASVGAGFSIILLSELNIGFNNLFGLGLTPIFAFIGAILTVLLVYRVSKVGNTVPIVTLLLAGIATSTILSAVMSLMLYFSDDIVQPLVYWLMGSFNARTWIHVITILPYPIIGFLIIYRKAVILDIFTMGESKAKQLGVNVEKEKKLLLIVSAFLTAAAVSLCGVIGFVGLLIPHIIRLIHGPNNKQLVWRSFIWGGNFLIIADTIARTILSPTELPVGIITSLCGGPFFIYLLKKQQGKYWQ